MGGIRLLLFLCSARRTPHDVYPLCKMQSQWAPLSLRKCFCFFKCSCTVRYKIHPPVLIINRTSPNNPPNDYRVTGSPLRLDFCDIILWNLVALRAQCQQKSDHSYRTVYPQVYRYWSSCYFAFKWVGVLDSGPSAKIQTVQLEFRWMPRSIATALGDEGLGKARPSGTPKPEVAHIIPFSFTNNTSDANIPARVTPFVRSTLKQ